MSKGEKISDGSYVLPCGMIKKLGLMRDRDMKNYQSLGTYLVIPCLKMDEMIELLKKRK